MKGTRTYFASDFHLGLDHLISSKDRATIIIRWLESIKEKAAKIYLVGDIFDFWFEYQHVIPKGHTRFLGKLAELSDSGIEIHFLKGNHDMWVFDYFSEELSITVHDHQVILPIDGKKFYITHGDGLGSGDLLYKIIKYFLRHPWAQKLYACIHPRIGIALMRFMSKTSRDQKSTINESDQFNHHIDYAQEVCISQDIDYFICGHIHTPLIRSLNTGTSIYCNLGDWVTHFTFAVWDGHQLTLDQYDHQSK